MQYPFKYLMSLGIMAAMLSAAPAGAAPIKDDTGNVIKDDSGKPVEDGEKVW